MVYSAAQLGYSQKHDFFVNPTPEERLALYKLRGSGTLFEYTHALALSSHPKREFPKTFEHFKCINESDMITNISTQR